MTDPRDPSAGSALPAAPAASVNRISPVRFVVGFGIVSALGDVVYEGARSVIGPYLGSLGATAAVVGLITGSGEAAALVLRLFTGRLSDRTGKPWPQTIVGYALTAVCVPLVALTGNLAAAGLLYNGERVGKAVRTPARDTMLAHASAELGRGYAFGLHEALDQVGAMTGPLLLGAALALGGGYRLAFGLLAVPGALALLALMRLRASAPDPLAWEPAAQLSEAKRLRLEAGLPRQFWRYSAFSAATMFGFSTWAVLAFHLTTRHLLSPAVVPVLYALAMGAASIAAVAFGRVYDRVGLRGLLVLPFLAAAVPFLSFSDSAVLFVLGSVVWGPAWECTTPPCARRWQTSCRPIDAAPARAPSPPSTGSPGSPAPLSSAGCTNTAQPPRTVSSSLRRPLHSGCFFRCCATGQVPAVPRSDPRKATT